MRPDDSNDVEHAEWIDDYFGSHIYGVRFPSDGKVFREDDYHWEENKAKMCWVPHGRDDGKPITVEQTKAGKTFSETFYPDGRKDVTVKVNSLDVDMSDPRNAEAKKVIEKRILPKIADKKLIVTLIHTPTRDHFTFICARKNVRANAEVAVKKHAGVFAPHALKDYMLVEHDVEAKEVKVTSIEP